MITPEPVGNELMTWDEKANRGRKNHFKPDILEAKYIILFGSSFLEANFPLVALGRSLMDFRAKGGKYVVVDPRFSNTAALAHRWVPIKPGGDAALALGMARWIVENGKYDAQYLANANQAAAKAAGEPARRGAPVERGDAEGREVHDVRASHRPGARAGLRDHVHRQGADLRGGLRRRAVGRGHARRVREPRAHAAVGAVREEMIDAGAWTRARGQLYRCLAAAFLRPPGDTFVAPFLGGETLAALGGRFGDDVVAELDRFRQDFDGDYEALDREYQSLFVVPLGRYVTPYEAVYRDERVVEDEVVRGLLMGPSTVAITALYREAGAEVAPDLLELPDHVGLELGCMHFLCEAEARAWERGDGPAAARAQQLQGRLLTDHLLQWIPALCRQIRANAPGPFYRGIADLTEALVRQDAEAAAGLAGVPREVLQCE